MNALWRISNYQTLSGIGGMKYSSRWNTKGHPIAYLAGSPAGALLETLVHLDGVPEEIPDRFTLLRVAVEAVPSVEDLHVSASTTWRDDTALTRSLGDEWLLARRSALARVPSALVPETFNYLLNPLHPEAMHLRISEAFQDRYDLRLLGRRS